MEIRQLEYFINSVEEKSFYKASEKLFTSQPAVSKAIALLEKDLNTKLFERTNKGIRITADGERLYHYAKNILRQVEIMKTPYIESDLFLRVASYPSGFISATLTDFFYNEKIKSKNHLNTCNVQMDYREGTVQDIINFITNGVSEVGIVYISPNQENAFRHILGHKNLEFIPLKNGELCIYVGKKHPLYDSNKAISIGELSKLQYVRGIRDFFSVEHHFDYVSLNEINTSHFNDLIITNSDHLVTRLLENTDMCYLGISTIAEDKKGKIPIDAKEKYLTLGYIKNKIANISPFTKLYLEYLSSLL